MATLRQISYNLPKHETGLKVGIQGKRLHTGEGAVGLPAKVLRGYNAIVLPIYQLCKRLLADLIYNIRSYGSAPG